MSIISGEEADQLYAIYNAALAWRKARRAAIAAALSAMPSAFTDLSNAEADLVKEVDYFEKHYGD